FVTSRKPSTNVLCYYLYCDCTNYTNYSNDGNVLVCRHGYHSRCLQRCNFKCLICLDYLQDAIKSNVEAIKVSMMKDLGKKKFMDENVESADKDDSDAKNVIGDIVAIDNLLDQAKKNFFEL